VSVVRLDEPAELSARVVLAVVRLRREKDQEPEVVVGRSAQLLLEHRDDFRRPEELVLEVDEPLRRAESAEV
jgi:hypothetical protein